MKAVLIDCKYQPGEPRQVFVTMQSRLSAVGVELTVDNLWSDGYAAADLIIGADPIADRPSLTNARLLGQRTLNRYERMAIAAECGAAAAPFVSPENDEQLKARTQGWGEFCVLKYDWSARRNGVFPWPLTAGRKPFPADFSAGCDLFMQFLDDDPRTYKIDAFCGSILGGWIFPTRSMRLADWQVVGDRNDYDFDPPAIVREQISAVSEKLIAHGVGYASFDLMQTQGEFKIIEINTCSVSTTAWNAWPERYGQTYSDAILQTLKRLDLVPKYRDIRQQAARAGNEQAAVILQERTQPAQSAQSASPAQQVDSAEATFFRSLSQADRLPYDGLVRFWQSTLEDLLVHAYRTVPFYKDRIKPLIETDGRVRWHKWTEFPLTRIDDIGLHRQAMLSRDVPAMHGAMQHLSIAGANGEAVAFSKSLMQLAAESCLRARLYQWHNVDTALPMATLLPGRSEQTNSDKDLPWAPEWLPRPLGTDHTGNFDAPAERQLHWLAGHGVPYLRTTPAKARALADAAAAGMARQVKLKMVLTQSEVLSDENRSRCLQYLCDQVVDAYDPLEAGMTALQCPKSAAYHSQLEVCLVEVVLPDGTPCGPGQTGEIVITPFYNYVMPLIRYATGDFAEMPAQVRAAGQACACGRHLPTIQRIKKRRQMQS